MWGAKTLDRLFAQSPPPGGHPGEEKGVGQPHPLSIRVAAVDRGAWLRGCFAYPNSDKHGKDYTECLSTFARTMMLGWY